MDISKVASFIEDASNLMAKVQMYTIQESTSAMDLDESTDEDVEVFDDIEVIDNEEIADEEDVMDEELHSTGDFSSICGNFGCVLGVSAQTMEAYSSWKEGNITDSEFLANIAEKLKDDEFKGAVSGIMVPISQTFSKLGITMPAVFPVAVIAAPVLGAVLNHAVNDSYNKTLQKARHYQSLNVMYEDFQKSILRSQYEYAQFQAKLEKQEHEYNMLKKQDDKVTSSLKNLYDSI